MVVISYYSHLPLPLSLSLYSSLSLSLSFFYFPLTPLSLSRLLPYHISNGAPLLLIQLNYTTLTTRFVFCNTKTIHSDPKIQFFCFLNLRL